MTNHMNRHTFARHLGRIKGSAKQQRKAREALVHRAHAVTIIHGGKIIGWRMPNGKVVCVKRRYSTSEAAAVDLARIRRVATHSYIPVRAYACPYCHGFHLTSRPA
jgi:hypothetical protein